MADIWKDRGNAFEEQWANAQDEELVKKMREKARLEEIAESLAQVLQVEHPDILKRVADLGVTLETGPALLLAPLVQIAWAEGKVTDDERATVLRLAHGRGLAETSPAYASSHSGSTSVRRTICSMSPSRCCRPRSQGSRRQNATNASRTSRRRATRWRPHPA